MSERRSFLNAALALVGHGSSKNPESRRSVDRHSAELRRRAIFGEVLECFYREPTFAREIWSKTTADEIFVIPMFISEGYFTQEVVPRELGLRANGKCEYDYVCRRGGRTLCYGRPVGTHPSMTDVVLAVAERALRNSAGGRIPRPEETALVIAGHGTPKNDQSREAIDRQVERIRRCTQYAEVHSAFIEEDPRIGGCYEFVQAPNLVVVPFFASDGMHVQEDIPVLLGAPRAEVCQRLREQGPGWVNPTCRNGKRVWCAGSVGIEPQLADVILDRVLELATALKTACVRPTS